MIRRAGCFIICHWHCVHHAKAEERWRASEREEDVLHYDRCETNVIFFGWFYSVSLFYSVWKKRLFRATITGKITALRWWCLARAVCFPHSSWSIEARLPHISWNCQRHTASNNELERNYRVSFMMSIPTPTEKHRKLSTYVPYRFSERQTEKGRESDRKYELDIYDAGELLPFTLYCLLFGLEFHLGAFNSHRN